MSSDWKQKRILKAGILTVISVLVVLALAATSHEWISSPSVEQGDVPSRKEAQQLAIIKPIPVKFMGSDSLNKAYNFLRGAGASPVHARAIGTFTILDGKRVKYGDSKDFEPDQVDLTLNAGCNSNSETRSIQETSSVGSVESFAKEESSSYAAQVEVSVSWPASTPKGFVDSLLGTGGKRNSVTVGGGFALAFGRSEAQKQSKSYATNGYQRSSSSFVESTLFNAYVASWENDRQHRPFKYDPSFLADVDELGRLSGAAGEKKAVEFMDRWGTHVIMEATYGMRCSSTMFMKGSDTMSGYETFLSSANSRDLEWNAYMNAQYHTAGGVGIGAKASAQGSESKKYQEATAKKGLFQSKIAYEIGSVKCAGYVKDNLCDKRFNAKTDNPVMIEYTPLEIWRIKIPAKDKNNRWTAKAEQNLKAALGAIGSAWMDCSAKKCEGKGYCTISDRFWDVVRYGAYNRNLLKNFAESFGNECVLENPFGSLFANIPFTNTGKCAKTNIALNKPSSQSSTNGGSVAKRGNDGSTQTYVETTKQNEPWFVIDLQKQDARVCGVDIVARANCGNCHKALTKFAVFVTNRKPLIQNNFMSRPAEFCGSYDGAPFSGTKSIGCGKVMTGRYVGIQIFKKNIMLSFAELRAFGFIIPTPQPTPKPTLVCPQNDFNVAKGKAAFQSSLCCGGYPFRATDGNVNSNYNGGSCTHTNSDNQAFWAVDLRGSYRVCRVKITNRADCCGNRLSNFDIFVSNTIPSARNPAQGSRSETCAHIGGTFAGTREFRCATPIVGRYVSIRLRGRNPLTLCEVQVFGQLIAPTAAGQAYTAVGCRQDAASRTMLPVRFVTPNPNGAMACAAQCSGSRYFGPEAGKWCGCGERLTRTTPANNCNNACAGNPKEMCGGHWALNLYQRKANCKIDVSKTRRKRAWQSSECCGGNPSKAVDGNHNTNYNGGSCTHTNLQSGGYWVVDMGSSQPVCSMKIWNRMDCCTERLRDFIIFVTDRRPSGNAFSPTSNERCTHVLGNFGNSLEFFCDKTLRGRYVGVVLQPRDHLTLCEVEVGIERP